MKKIYLVSIVSLLILSGCEPTAYPQMAIDQTQRTSLFNECLRNIPVGPTTTTYNDWDEVVSTCSNSAYYRSMFCYKNCPGDSKKELKSGDVPL